MFGFEKLTVYKAAKKFHSQIRVKVTKQKNLDKAYSYQLTRASLSIVLNIAEGTSRFTNPSARNFYIISRGSLFETVSMLGILQSEGLISNTLYEQFYSDAQKISYSLYRMIKRLESN